MPRPLWDYVRARNRATGILRFIGAYDAHASGAPLPWAMALGYAALWLERSAERDALTISSAAGRVLASRELQRAIVAVDRLGGGEAVYAWCVELITKR